MSYSSIEGSYRKARNEAEQTRDDCLEVCIGVLEAIENMLEVSGTERSPFSWGESVVSQDGWWGLSFELVVEGQTVAGSVVARRESPHNMEQYIVKWNVDGGTPAKAQFDRDWIPHMKTNQRGQHWYEFFSAGIEALEKAVGRKAVESVRASADEVDLSQIDPSSSS